MRRTLNAQQDEAARSGEDAVNIAPAPRLLDTMQTGDFPTSLKTHPLSRFESPREVS
eukprot:CAMPEP_0179409268 /NCGR_PEP_ID=MMETSP0799-20121207/2601_1 /TAXON_ID=46947 /ORGANISM="Geminigera cryophila, Strain CCMP2564" /LENGTH=56 /DNA_ID=CAMNT_0021180915 /DNA_START=519 /DNA_END=687 /DNA_ORIENTATION=+